MNSIRPAMLLVLVTCLLQAQPLVDREALAKIPLGDAIVLDPVGPWQFSRYARRPLYTNASGMDLESGHPRIVVAEANALATWQLWLAIPFDPQRYPVAILTYRATGILPSNEPLLQVRGSKGLRATVLRNRDLVPDGEVREALMDLRECEIGGDATMCSIIPHCRGPEPAVFELLGLRFESDHSLPPLEKLEDAEFPFRVVDASGKPVPGATVTMDSERLNGTRSGLTDAEGRIALWVPANPQGRHSVRVTKEGMAITEFAPLEDESLPETLPLWRGSRYGGIVQDEEGNPVPNVSVRLHMISPPWAQSPRGWVEANVLTDAEGRWRTGMLPDEEVSGQLVNTLRLFHPDYLSEGDGYLNQSKAELREQRLVVVIHRGIQFAGQVLDPAGQPVGDAELALLRDYSDDGGERARTNPDGHFAFQSRLRGQRILAVQSPRFAAHAEPVFLHAGTPEWTVRLEPGLTVRGRVIDPSGQPLSGVAVKLGRWQPIHELSWQGTTDSDGRFAWGPVPPGTPYFTFTKPGHAKLYWYPLLPGSAEQTIVLPRCPSICGAVTDADTGQPIPDGTVVGGFVRQRPGLPAPSISWDSTHPRSLRDGYYEIQYSQISGPQALALRFEAPGYFPTVVQPLSPTLPEQVVDAQLRRGEPLHGKVLLPDGKPAVGALLHVAAPGKTLVVGPDAPFAIPPDALTDESGTYAFPSPQEPGYLFVAHPNGCAQIDIRNRGTAVDISLVPWTRIGGVYRLGNRPAERLSLSLFANPTTRVGDTPAVSYSGASTTDSAGRFAFHYVWPGTYVLGPHLYVRAHGSVVPSRREEVTVASGQTLILALGGSGRAVTGRVQLPEDIAQRVGWDAALGVIRRSGDSASAGPAREYPRLRPVGYYFALKEDNSFRVEDIPAGNYELLIEYRSPVPEKAVYDGRALARVECDFAIPEMPDGRSDDALDLGVLLTAP